MTKTTVVDGLLMNAVIHNKALLCDRCSIKFPQALVHDHPGYSNRSTFVRDAKDTGWQVTEDYSKPDMCPSCVTNDQA